MIKEKTEVIWPSPVIKATKAENEKTRTSFTQQLLADL